MFLLVSKFKIIGMLLHVVHGQVQKKLTKTYNKGFLNHSTFKLILTMEQPSKSYGCLVNKRLNLG